MSNEANNGLFTHGLLRRTREIAGKEKHKLNLGAIVSSPLAIVVFADIAPQYNETVLSLLPLSKPAFWHRACSTRQFLQSIILGASAECKVYNASKMFGFGGVGSEIDGLRAQLIHMLQGAGGSLTSPFECTSNGLVLP